MTGLFFRPNYEPPFSKGSCIFLASSGAAFNMYGGAIAGNMAKRDITTDGYSKDAATYGGGVYVAGGTFEMSGTAAISNNTATTFGGGVYVGSNATFTMTGGTIGGSADVVDENDIQG